MQKHMAPIAHIGAIYIIIVLVVGRLRVDPIPTKNSIATVITAMRTFTVDNDTLPLALARSTDGKASQQQQQLLLLLLVQ
jgi:hypothetical protein